MSPAEKKQFGKDNRYRIEYAYGALSQWDRQQPIILKIESFWMPLSRAKKIHNWLGRAIAKCENKRRKKDEKRKNATKKNR